MKTEFGCRYVFKHHNNSTHIVVGVEDPGNVLSQVSVQHSLNVATNINCGTAAVTHVQIPYHVYSLLNQTVFSSMTIIKQYR